jgi:hypothetical protein
MRRCFVWLGIALLAAAVGAGGMYYVQLNRQAREIAELKESLLRLTRQERRAELRVLNQEQVVGRVRTTLRFTELTPQGELGEPRVFTIDGDVVFIDALIVKFDDALVIAGDQTRGHPLLLFRRAYGEQQAPGQGFPLYDLDAVPDGYRSARPMSDWERRLWADFWKVARDPEKYGVRAAHGTVSYLQVDPNTVWQVELRASGELTIRPQKAAR